MMMVMMIDNDDDDDLVTLNPINNDPLKVAAISAQECLSPTLHHDHDDFLYDHDDDNGDEDDDHNYDNSNQATVLSQVSAGCTGRIWEKLFIFRTLWFTKFANPWTKNL